MHAVDGLVFDDDADEFLFDVSEVGDLAIVDIHFDVKGVVFGVDPFVAEVGLRRIGSAFVNFSCKRGVEQEAAFFDRGFFAFRDVFVVDVFNRFEHGIDVREIFQFGFGSQGVEKDFSDAFEASIKFNVGQIFVGVHHAHKFWHGFLESSIGLKVFIIALATFAFQEGTELLRVNARVDRYVFVERGGDEAFIFEA